MAVERISTAIRSFFKKWYNEGIDTDPPPCLKNKTFYCICSENIGCYFVGLMGTQWGDENRSQIFFVAFWLSFIGLIMLCNGMASLSTDSSSIVSMPLFQGALHITDQDGVTSDLHYYAGMARMVVKGCDAGETCPPPSLGWGDDSCRQYFTNCDDCKMPPNKVSVPIVMSLLGQVGQIATDLNRSTVRFDLHCQKFLGLFAGVMGMIGNLMALADFGTGCMAKLHINPAITGSMTRTPSTAFAMICIATLMRLYDLWAHIIVPVPKVDYWRPDTNRALLTVDVEAMERGTEVHTAGSKQDIRYPAKLRPTLL